MDRSDEMEIRATLDEATDQALELADELATLTAANPGGAPAQVAKAASNYLQQRTLTRRLRQALNAAVVG